jgi:hypothetical protein
VHGAAIVVSVRFFTPDEANALLPRVRPLAARMVAHAGALRAAEERRAELQEHIAGNGGDITQSDVAEVTAAVASEVSALTAIVTEVQELGVQVKDVDIGLVDFPSLRDGEEILLCWRLGEDEVAFWHGLEEGYAGRKPL